MVIPVTWVILTSQLGTEKVVADDLSDGEFSVSYYKRLTISEITTYVNYLNKIKYEQ